MHVPLLRSEFIRKCMMSVMKIKVMGYTLLNNIHKDCFAFLHVDTKIKLHAKHKVHHAGMEHSNRVPFWVLLTIYLLICAKA